MSELFKNKYRIPSARLPHWDYGSDAAYFITICTKDKECFFGKIENNGIEVIHEISEIGKIAGKLWQEIPEHFSFAKLDEFVVMPNHVHGILIINKSADAHGRDAINRVSTMTPGNPETCLNPTGGFAGSKNPMLNENLSRIIRWYKGRSSFEMRKIHADFEWQARFHDHIIRNETSYQKIRQYIFDNPAKWPEDKFYETK